MKLAFLQLSDLRDLDLYLGSGHMAYCHLSLIDLYLHIKFRSKSEKLFVYGRRTYVLHTDAHMHASTDVLLYKII